MALGPAAETFVLELRCLEDGDPAPDTISGEGLGGLRLPKPGGSAQAPEERPSAEPRARRGRNRDLRSGRQLAVLGDTLLAVLAVEGGRHPLTPSQDQLRVL